jgi:drug/metabolite transporter (DMT)-like permease
MNSQSSNVKPLDLCLFRTFVAFVVSGLIIQFSPGVTFVVPKSEHKTLFIRSFVGTIGFTSYVYAIQNLSMGLLMILYNTAPFWASLLAWIFLNEVLRLRETLSMVLAFTGVLAIALAKPSTSAQSENGNKLIGCACAITLSLAYAVVSVATRKMQKIHYAVVLFYYAVFSVFVLAAMLCAEALYDGTQIRVLHLEWAQYGMMTLTSVFNTFALITNTIALQNEKSGFVTLIGYISVLYAFAGDILIFKQGFTVQEILGASLIFCVMVYLVLS